MNRGQLHWTEGNRLELLENGEAFFPRVLSAIAVARREVRVETFILAFDAVGKALQQALIAAARDGRDVQLAIDGYGSAELPQPFIDEMTSAGVRVLFHDPAPMWLGIRRNLFRRLHRKLVVVDGRLAFVGGINFVADHLRSFGVKSKQDYAVLVEGPVVLAIRRLLDGVGTEQPRSARSRLWPRRKPPAVSSAASPTGRVALVTRDNQDHRRDIEREYRLALRTARRDVIIANAYFFSSWRLLRTIARAARRGVRVRLLLQGEPDIALVRSAASTLYDYLLRAGVEIHEYCERPFHGKVAVVDEDWSTIGSSNLDPLSLALNLEANLCILDHGFNLGLRRSLERLLMEKTSRRILRRRPSWWRQGISMIIFQLLKRYPAVVGMFPGHAPPEPKRVRQGQDETG